MFEEHFTLGKFNSVHFYMHMAHGPVGYFHCGCTELQYLAIVYCITSTVLVDLFKQLSFFLIQSSLFPFNFGFNTLSCTFCIRCHTAKACCSSLYNPATWSCEPLRHEKPTDPDDPLADQNIKDRYYGINDPVADKLLKRASTMPRLDPPEDKSITTLYVGGLGDSMTETDLR